MSTQSDQPEEVVDASKYMRTYAKDMAALSKAQGQQPVQQPAPKPAPEPKAKPKEQMTDGVALPDVDESLITQDRIKKAGDETLDLSDTPTEGSVSIFEQKKEEPLIEEAPEPRREPAPISGMSMAPNADADRKSILARLKQQALMREQAAAAAQPLEPATPISAPAPRPEPAPVSTMSMAPSADTTRSEVLARLRARAQERSETPIAAPAPVPPPRPEPPPPPAPVAVPAPKPEPFHSYKTDFADRIDTQRASTFSVLAAQADAKPRSVVRSATPARRTVRPAAVVATLFVVAGIGALSFSVIYYLTRPETVAVTQGVPSLIAADETKKLEGVTGTELMLALRNVSMEPLVSGNVLVTYTTSASSTTKGFPIELPQPGGALVKALALNAPDILMRNVRPESTVGVIHAGSETKPFFILKVSSFERTFAGMLAWEPVMRNSLSLIYPSYPNAPVAIDETATTTEMVAPPPAPRAPASFVDAVVRNHDVRVLRDSAGRSLMLYGYKDKETLIIVRDEAAFLELVARLNASGK